MRLHKLLMSVLLQLEMKTFTITAILAALFAAAVAVPVPEEAGIPCPTSWPKNGGIGPVCEPQTTTATPTATPYAA